MRGLSALLQSKHGTIPSVDGCQWKPTKQEEFTPSYKLHYADGCFSLWGGEKKKKTNQTTES